MELPIRTRVRVYTKYMTHPPEKNMGVIIGHHRPSDPISKHLISPTTVLFDSGEVATVSHFVVEDVNAPRDDSMFNYGTH